MSSSLPRRSFFVHWLQISLVVGAVYDLLLALAFLVAPGQVAAVLEIPLPGEAFYLWLIALFLLMLAAFYLLAAYDPVAYVGNIVLAIAGRAVAAMILVLAVVTSEGELAGLYLPAAVDALFAAVHAVLWWSSRR